MGSCYNLVTVCKHAYIVATNRPTIDRRDYKDSEGLIIAAVWNRSSPQELDTAVRHGSSSGVVYTSSRQMKNQKKLLVYVK
jgi:hypothetical protein